MERRASPPGNHNTGRARRSSLHRRRSCRSHLIEVRVVCADESCLRDCYSANHALLARVRFHKLSEEKEIRLTLGRKLGLGFGVILGLIVVDTTLTYLQAKA